MIGKHRWAIPDGYIPETSTGPEPEMTGHGTVSIRNAGEDDGTIEVTIYVADGEPAGPCEPEVPGERTRHARFNDLVDPEAVPKGTASRPSSSRTSRSSASTRAWTPGRPRTPS